MLWLLSRSLLKISLRGVWIILRADALLFWIPLATIGGTRVGPLLHGSAPPVLGYGSVEDGAVNTTTIHFASRGVHLLQRPICFSHPTAFPQPSFAKLIDIRMPVVRSSSRRVAGVLRAASHQLAHRVDEVARVIGFVPPVVIDRFASGQLVQHQ